jgi:hypothetical protein
VAHGRLLARHSPRDTEKCRLVKAGMRPGMS